jgi:hypothetical protein
VKSGYGLLELAPLLEASELAELGPGVTVVEGKVGLVVAARLLVSSFFLPPQGHQLLAREAPPPA